jgi:hypothetical protein
VRRSSKLVALAPISHTRDFNVLCREARPNSWAYGGAVDSDADRVAAGDDLAS